MAEIARQRWSAERYAETAHFVPALGAPVLELLVPSPGEHILDLGCGDGVFGASVQRTEEFAPAFEEAAAGKGPAIIELKMDPEMITTRTTLSEIRREAEARQVQGMEV